MKKMLTLALAGIMALSLTACGSGSSGSSGGSAGNVLTVGCKDLTGTFSSLYSSTVYDGYVVDLVYEKLMNFNINNEMEPQLASKYEFSEDGSEITFYLEKGHKFSDGTEVTAKDVEFTIKTISDPSYTGRFGYIATNLKGYENYSNPENTTEPEFEGIQVIDDYTIKFSFTEVKSDNLANIATTNGIVSANEFKDATYGNKEKALQDKMQTPMGSGPYKLAKWDASAGASFEKNPNYSGDGYAIENIIIKPVEQATQVQEIQNGNIDLLPNMGSAKVVGPASNDENLAMNEFMGSAVAYACFNTANGATSDINVRKALAYAFDRKSLNDSYFECADCKMESDSIAYSPSTLNNPISAVGDVVTNKETIEGMETYQYDLEKAKQILDDAGWKVGSDGVREKDGQKLTIKYLASQDSGYVDATVNILNKSWKEDLGVDLQIASVDFNTIQDKVTHEASLSEWNMFTMGVSFTTDSMADLIAMIHGDNVGEGKDNYAHLNDAELNTLLDKALVEIDNDKALEIWKEACKELNSTAAYIPTYGNNIYDIYNKKLKNLKTSALQTWPRGIKDATIE